MHDRGQRSHVDLPTILRRDTGRKQSVWTSHQLLIVSGDSETDLICLPPPAAAG